MKIATYNATPAEIRRGLPGDESDGQARYLEAEVMGLVVASIYLPNGNPQPCPKFDYKLAWFDRLIARASDHAPTWISLQESPASEVSRRSRPPP